MLRGSDPAKCAVIDPADNGREICGTLERLGTTPDAILLTHGHYDHFLAVPYLQERWPSLPVYCHALDCPRETEEDDEGVIYPTVSAFRNLRHYGDGDSLTIGGLNVQVMTTPGHTLGSVTLIVEDALFTGDTLFKGDIGRTDFKGGDDKAMMQSLARLASLKGNYRVFPGHDAATTLSDELEQNPYLKIAQKQYRT